MTAAEIAFHLHGKRIPSGYLARCPAHRDNNPSLSLNDAEDGRVLVHCHAGCTQEAVVDALRELGLWPVREQAGLVIAAEYNYTDERGELLYQILRYSPKAFKQRQPDGCGGWLWKKHPQQVLYRLREVIEAPIVFVVEGERDAETLRSYGFVATTNAGGAKAHWLPQYTDALTGREVIVWPDDDPPGRQRAATIARALLGHAKDLSILHHMDAKDATAWFEQGHSDIELIELLERDYAAL